MPDLPFGKTDLTSQALVKQIDYPEATTQLAHGGVIDPSNQLDSFLSDLPDLLDRLETTGRQFPWRFTDDPWRVYVSEILLQRTRANAVESIYDEFFNKYPNPAALNRASEAQLRETIDSLGFGNQRTRTLFEVAELTTQEYDGRVPRSVEALKKPWRVGDYSARATLLFAFHESKALVDANIARIIGRYFDYEMPRQPHKDSDVYTLMHSLTPAEPAIARAFYFSLIDHGALLCTSSNPECANCPIATQCQDRLSRQNSR
jgi:A/G-specific adenine glycosylase